MALRRVVVGAADVGDELAGLVVEGDHRPVVDVLAAEVPHPLGVGELERLRQRRRVLAVRHDGRRLDPFLGDRLEPDVERGRDRQAALLEGRAGRPPRRTACRRAPAGPPRRSGARPSGGVTCGARTTTSFFASSSCCGRVLVAGDRRPAARRGAPGSGSGAGRSPRSDRRRAATCPDAQVSSVSSRADRVALRRRVLREVVVRGRLRQPGEDRRLGRGELEQVVDAEVGLRRRLHAVGLVAVVVLVQVVGDDLLLAGLARVGLRQADRLDDLLDLPLERPVRILDERRVEQPLADELLGDRRRAAAAAAEAVEPGRDDRERDRSRRCPRTSCPRPRSGRR